MINPSIFDPLKMKRIIIMSFFLPLFAQCQQMQPECSDIKNGYFYFYPKNSTDHYIDTRNGNIAIEINSKTGDSTVWDVQWKNDCIYSLKYKYGNEKMTAEQTDILEQHKLVYEILTITDEYYTFRGYLDKTSGNPIQTDTMWLHQKINVGSNALFKQEKNNFFLKREHFSDTSKYAVLYIYRSGKILNCMLNHLIYLDDVAMCICKNNSGYIFKIYKEGQHTLMSKLNKDETSIRLDIKFGEKYYIKSIVFWGVG